MKVAAAQTVVSDDVSKNAAVIKELISQAAAQGARLVHFCEGALSGYSKAQIKSPACWQTFDWGAQEKELRGIARLCGQLKVFVVVGGAHRLEATLRPHNSLYVFSDTGHLLTRYDKRFLSNSEVAEWYAPGAEPIMFEVDGYRFGCAVCIESQFPELFVEYERMGVDAVLFGSYGIPEHFQIALRAHAGLNCIWIVAATPAQEADHGAAGIIGPDGKWSRRCPEERTMSLSIAELDRNDPSFDIPLKKARPWRAKARLGKICRDLAVSDARSLNRSEY